jgi:hypothetical protein
VHSECDIDRCGILKTSEYPSSDCKDPILEKISLIPSTFDDFNPDSIAELPENLSVARYQVTLILSQCRFHYRHVLPKDREVRGSSLHKEAGYFVPFN